MTGYLFDYKSNTLVLPELISWEISHTDGNTGTDNFEICCLYDSAMVSHLENAVRFKCEHEGQTVFYGIVDEYSVLSDVSGKTVSISGRGLGGILIDNKCRGQEFIACSLRDILDRYVKPYGITSIEGFSPRTVYGYSVSTGDSALSALSQFLDISANTVPRFSPAGELILSGKTGKRWSCDDKKCIKTEITGKRYGVISHVDILTADGYRQTVKNEPFIQRGGLAGRVITVPRNTSWDMMKYSGKYRIEQSEKDSYKVELTVSEMFPVFPGDVVALTLPDAVCGDYHVSETTCFGNGNGYGTKITLTRQVK